METGTYVHESEVNVLKWRVKALENEIALEKNSRRYEAMLQWRDIYPEDGDIVCKDCQGSGYKGYGCTSTWRGGAGGQQITSDVCDKCWGSGMSNKPWANLRRFDIKNVRELESRVKELELENSALNILKEDDVEEMRERTARMDSAEKRVKELDGLLTAMDESWQKTELALELEKLTVAQLENGDAYRHLESKLASHELCIKELIEALSQVEASAMKYAKLAGESEKRVRELENMRLTWDAAGIADAQKVCDLQAKLSYYEKLPITEINGFKVLVLPKEIV